MAVILSYNVNGLRAAMRKGFGEWLKASNPDVICLQEVKAHPDQLDLVAFEELGYHHHWAVAEKKGYSGVAILSKTELTNVSTHSPLEVANKEGRLIRADLGDLTILSLYFPSGSSQPERQAIKMEFLSDFGPYLEGLMQERQNIILAGDFNIAHQKIDIHDPQRNAKSPGFLPEERNWLTRLLDRGFIDAFRHFNAEPHQYTWWSYRTNARARNRGWRIDYQLVSENLAPRLQRSVLLTRANHSDHCPVLVEISDK